MIATNETSLYDPSGAPRTDFALADVFGTHRPAGPVNRLLPITQMLPGGGRGGGLTTAGFAPGAATGGAGAVGAAGGAATGAGRGGNAAGPGTGRGGGAAPAGVGRGGATPGVGATLGRISARLCSASPATRRGPGWPSSSKGRNPTRTARGTRYWQASTIPTCCLYGGTLGPLTVESDRVVTMTFIPPFPSLPVDENYIREDKLDCPGLIVGNFGQGRVAFMPADFDRRLGLDPIIDHYALMTNVFEWALGIDFPVIITGRATVATSLLRQNGRLVLHMVNLTGADNQAAPVTDYTPVGPLRVSLRIPPASSWANHQAGRIGTEAIGPSGWRRRVSTTGVRAPEPHRP